MLKIRDRLYYKQAKWALGLMLVLSISISSFQIYSDWQEEKANIHSRIESSLNTVKSAATEAAYSLDANLAKQVVAGLIQSNVFREVSFRDDLGNELAHFYRPMTHPAFYWLTQYLFRGLVTQVSLPLIYHDALHVGVVKAYVDVKAVTASFLARSSRLVVTTLLACLLFGLAVLTLIYLQTSRPLTNFIAKLSLLNDTDYSKQQLNFPEAARNDELGVLSRTFSALWHQQKHVESELAKSESYFKAVLHQSSECLLLADLKGRILDCNHEACRLLGYAKNELLLLSIQDIDPRYCVEQLAQWIKAQQGDVTLFETDYLRHDGGKIPVEVRSNVIVLDGYSRLLASVRDITQRKKDQEKVNFLAYYDALTELPNRRFLNTHLDKVVTDAHDQGHIGGLLFVDLDHFKSINDSLGHHVGDALLVDVAKRIVEPLSEGHIAARIGGDEFVILLPNLGKEMTPAQDKAAELANTLMNSLTGVFHLHKKDVFISASIGISLFPSDDANDMHVLQQADTAMYEAKSSGRNGFYFYRKEMQEQTRAQSQIQEALHYALKRSEMYLVYQPQVDLHGNIIGFEALLRWHNNELGMVSPNYFIPIAESMGLIEKIGTWVLEQGCMQLAQWQREGLPEHFAHLAINISPSQFAKDNFVDTVRQVIDISGVDARLLVLEITEGMLVENISDVADKMRMLKALGVSFSIDDFGTGYASLRYLQCLPLNQLKIDQSFVRAMQEDANSQIIIKTIITMAHDLGLSVVAEGVASREENTILKDLGCEYFQGYYFSFPVRVHKASLFLRQALVLPLTQANQTAYFDEDYQEHLRLEESLAEIN